LDIYTILYLTIHRGKLWNNFQGSLSTFTVLDRQEGSHWTGVSVHNIGIAVQIYIQYDDRSVIHKDCRV
jgi:hypothetical protein